MAQQRETPRVAATKDANKQRYIRRAIESASEYNLFLNRQRQRVYMDLQTDTPNYPVGLGRENKTLTRTTKIGRFPVAVIPSQYQDWYIEYTPEELDFLPVDTVLRGPIMRIDQLPPVLTTPDVSDFDSDSESESCCSTSSEDCSSCCSCCAQNDAQQQQQQQQQQSNANNPSNPSDETRDGVTTLATTSTITATTSSRRKSHAIEARSIQQQMDANSTDTTTTTTTNTNPSNTSTSNGTNGRGHRNSNNNS